MTMILMKKFQMKIFKIVKMKIIVKMVQEEKVLTKGRKKINLIKRD